jgi:hypothetical protein
MANNKIQTKLFDLYKESKFSADVDSIIKHHLNCFHNNSQIAVYNSLKENLKNYIYSKPVVSILEKIQDEINQDVVYYELEDLLRFLEDQNQGMVFRPVMKVVLDVMNEVNMGARHKKIMNELKLYDWVRPIAEFMFRYTQNPLDKQNISSRGGRAEQVYTFVESVVDGQLVYIKNKWFMIKEDTIFPVVLFDYVKDIERLRKLNIIQTCLELTQFDNDIMSFRINEDLTIGVSIKTGELLLNGEKAERSTTLESIFNSPQIPVLKRDFFLIIQECIGNKSQFKNLDIALHISNVVNPNIETYAFKYEGKCYAYILDGFSGSTFFQYESVSTLIREVDIKLGFDLSEFFKEQLDAQKQLTNKIQDTQKLIYQQIDEINENIEKLESSSLFESNEQIKKAHAMLKGERTALIDKLKKIGDKASSETTIINSEADLQPYIDAPTDTISVEAEINEPSVMESLNESLVAENSVGKYTIYGKDFEIYGIKENKEDEDFFTFDVYCEGKLLNKGFTFYSIPSSDVVRNIAIETYVI